MTAAHHRMATMKGDGARALVWMLTAAAVLMALTVVYPQIDLRVSGLFFRDGTFPLRHSSAIMEFVRLGFPRIVLGCVAYLTIVWLAGEILRTPMFGLTRRIMAYLLLTLAIGPGLAVNTLFKDSWGRARPSQIEAFGGDKIFSSAPWMSNQCEDNCSFVSGHAALAFWLVAFAFLAPKPYRAWAVIGALGFGFLIGLVRVMQGAHFLSDVLFAGAVVLAVVYGGYRLLIAGKATETVSRP